MADAIAGIVHTSAIVVAFVSLRQSLRYRNWLENVVVLFTAKYRERTLNHRVIDMVPVRQFTPNEATACMKR